MFEFYDNLLSQESCATMASKRGFSFKNRNFGGISPGQEAPKTFLDRGVHGCRIISV